jgi:hypothetical protein
MTQTRLRTTACAVLSVLALALSACGLQDDSAADAKSDSKAGSKAEPGDHSSPSEAADAHAHGDSTPGARTPLRAGERRVTVRMPKPYRPSAPTGTGTDDYRCFLLDPKVPSDQFITGFNVKPGNPEVVHHVILFRVPADLVAQAEKKDAGTPGQGWTCFGASGLGRGTGGIDDAPWVGAWAPGGSEQVYGAGFGEELGKGSRVVMQVHYNLLAGTQSDRSGAELRLAPVSDDIKPLETRLLPAPVEMPCRPEHSDGELCSRPAALRDVKKRFGKGPGSTADLLHFLCGEIKAGPVQSCIQRVTRPETVHGVAGHMHLLGRSIKLEVNPGEPDARTLLDIPVWDFDNQASRSVKPTKLEPGDTLKVTCRHEQSLRDQLPSFEGQPDKYVLWGDGTTDEMCLGIMLVTRP